MNIDQIMNPTTPSKADVLAALKIAAAIAETIREVGEVPSGTLYAQLCDRMSLEAYEGFIRALKAAGLVSESAHLLTWTGPLKGAKA
jgi:hypothetical protein